MMEVYNSYKDAIISLPEKGGTGVFVTGDLIITATHCIQFQTDGSMPLNNQNLSIIQTKNHGTFKANVLYAELINDLAILGPADDQECYDDYSKYLDYCSKVKPMQVYPGKFEELFKKYEAYIFNFEGELLKIKHKKTMPEAQLHFFESENTLKFGYSGSPIVNKHGHVIGIVSNTSFNQDDSVSVDGTFPLIRELENDKFLKLMGISRGPK